MQPFLAMITPLSNGGPTPPTQPPPAPAHPIVIPPGTPPLYPSHPIYYPDLGPAHPIVIPPGPVNPPVFPSHPIVIPPGVPAHPIYFPDPVPTHPIVLPPEQAALFDWHTAWTEETGWIVVGVPNGKVPTPSGG